MARILVVEDDPAQRFLFVTLIRRIGYDAIGASDASAAFDILASGVPVHAVLADMSLPKLDGPAFLRALAESYPHIPCIAMSVRSPKEWQMDPADGVPFLLKPFARDVLARTLRDVIGQHGDTFA
jgi:CheY-like chemotaxis protein